MENSNVKRKSDNNPESKQKKRFLWPEDLHRNFIMAVFDTGLKFASPKSVSELAPLPVPNEQLQLQIELFRRFREDPTKEFLLDDDFEETSATLVSKKSPSTYPSSPSSSSNTFPLTTLQQLQVESLSRSIQLQTSLFLNLQSLLSKQHNLQEQLKSSNPVPSQSSLSTPFLSGSTNLTHIQSLQQIPPQRQHIFHPSSISVSPPFPLPPLSSPSDFDLSTSPLNPLITPPLTSSHPSSHPFTHHREITQHQQNQHYAPPPSPPPPPSSPSGIIQSQSKDSNLFDHPHHPHHHHHHHHQYLPKQQPEKEKEKEIDQDQKTVPDEGYSGSVPDFSSSSSSSPNLESPLDSS